MMEEKRPVEDNGPSDNIIRTTSLLDERSENRQFKFISYRRAAEDRAARVRYLWKPFGFIVFGSLLICCGIVLTTFHFMYEGSAVLESPSPPFFTYGPMTLASGFVNFMIGIIWFSMKLHKWKVGSASPISKAMAAAAHLAANTAFTEKAGRVPQSL